MIFHKNSANRSACPKPFTWCEIHPAGKVFLCCPGWLKSPVGDLLKQSFAEIWNGPTAVEIRKTIHNDSYHRCNARRCPFLVGGRTFPAVTDEVAESALTEGLSTLPYGPKVLNLCFDHSCNLACPSCRTHFEQSRSGQRQYAEAVADRVISESGFAAGEIRLSGFGDPLASPVYRRLLGAIGPQTFPSLQRLHLHTNGLLWDESLWGKMTNLHPYLRSAEISVDAAVAETYAANRAGGEFERLLDNLEFIARLPIELKLSFVVQANNFRQMPAFVDLARRYSASAYFSQLVNWGTFSGDEYRRRAVHLREHPQHADFRKVLEKVAIQQDVDAGNLLPIAV